MKEINKKFSELGFQNKKNTRSCCSASHFNNEKFFWVPKETFDFTQKIKENLQGQILNNETIEILLFEVRILLIIIPIIFNFKVK